MADKLSLLSMGDLGLALNDLFAKRLSFLQQSQIGRIYEPILKQRLERLNAAPALYKGGRPLVAELEQEDARHDGYIETMLRTTEGALSDPDAPIELKVSAKKILDALQLKPGDKAVDYPKEASRAKEREEQVKQLEPSFKLFPLSGGRTLYDTALSYLSSGSAIDALVAERTRLEAKQSERGDLRELRNELLGRINRCRASIQYEQADNPALPQSLDAAIFGYFDELQKTRETQSHNRAESRAKAEAEARINAAVEARRLASEAELNAQEQARKASEAQRRAQEAKLDAEKKSQD